jgi:hypothetical protein
MMPAGPTAARLVRLHRAWAAFRAALAAAKEEDVHHIVRDPAIVLDDYLVPLLQSVLDSATDNARLRGIDF